MKLKIRRVPDPILRKKSKPVRKTNSQVEQLAEAMIEMIKKGKNKERIGVGLSAVQVGKPIRLFVAYSPQTKKDQVFVNPKITWRSKRMTKGIPSRELPYEGCLSVPGYLGLVKRHWTIKLSWQNLNGRHHEKKISGFVATVIQHEVDHLDGILFIDRVLEQKGKLYKIEKDKENKQVLLEVEFS